MLFRTEIDIRRSKDVRISHDDSIFMLGSCFSDNVGAELERDGFKVRHNPMGPLYHPIPLLCALRRYMGKEALYTPDDFKFSEADGRWHCLDFASRYSDTDAVALASRLNSEIEENGEQLRQSSAVIVTLGSAFAYDWIADGAERTRTVGNCHKFTAACFERHLVSVEQLQTAIEEIANLLTGKKVIFTISPIRHMADGLHGNQVSKSSLIVALNAASESHTVNYFPSYEIMLDDLRDYRFYAADMKHPSDVAIQYIYSKFAEAYFDSATLERAKLHRSAAARANHIPLQQKQ